MSYIGCVCGPVYHRSIWSSVNNSWSCLVPQFLSDDQRLDALPLLPSFPTEWSWKWCWLNFNGGLIRIPIFVVKFEPILFDFYKPRIRKSWLTDFLGLWRYTKNIALIFFMFTLIFKPLKVESLEIFSINQKKLNLGIKVGIKWKELLLPCLLLICPPPKSNPFILLFLPFSLSPLFIWPLPFFPPIKSWSAQWRSSPCKPAPRLRFCQPATFCSTFQR